MDEKKQWVTEGFDDFSKGTLGNGGQNLYVSKKGILQRIFQYDLNLDGKPDLLFACSQSMNERPPVYIYQNLPKSNDFRKLPGGAFDGLLADLNGNGYDDLVLACQHDGAHSDTNAIIYYGGPEGLCEQYSVELYAPNSVGVCAGDFRGSGKKDLVFLSDGKLRVFYQEKSGFAPAVFTDYALNPESVCAADMDNDGYDDLCVKMSDGSVGVIFGGPEGLNTEKIVWVTKVNGVMNANNMGSTTAGRASSTLSWEVSVLKCNDKQYLFTIQSDHPVFYTCEANRVFTPALRFDCTHVVSAISADFTGNGYDDIALAVFEGRSITTNCRVYLGAHDGFKESRYVSIPVCGATSLTAANLNGVALIICRAAQAVEQEMICPIYRLSADGTAVQISTVTVGDSRRILAGHPQGAQGNEQVIAVNHTLNRMGGHEKVYIYLGGEDGYQENRRIELPGHSAVEAFLCDFTDNGYPDVMVVNCFEDAPLDDDGCYIYLNDGSGVNPERKIKIPTVRAHGMAVGDFRKSGYLDLASGGWMNREVRIFHGSEKGYTLNNCSRLVFGEQTKEYQPAGLVSDGDRGAEFSGITEEERERITRDGQIRWLLAADLNGDGWLDLVVSQILGPKCYILWGGPNGYSLDRRTELLTEGVASAAVADLDKDGYPDLILASHLSTVKKSKFEAYLTIYWGGPNGLSEQRKQQLPAICANSVTVGDFNNTGNLDLFATAYQDGRNRDIWARVYANENGAFSRYRVQYLFNHSGSGCVAGDFNGDGYTDLAVAGHKEYGNHDSHSFVFWGGPDGLSDARKTILPATGPHGMSTVDPGNIMDRSEREYYTSQIKKTTEIMESIVWEGECTSTSWVELQVRAASSTEALARGTWTKVENGDNISHLGLTGFVQYRLALCAKCGCGTPRIRKVTVAWC